MFEIIFKLIGKNDTVRVHSADRPMTISGADCILVLFLRYVLLSRKNTVEKYKRKKGGNVFNNAAQSIEIEERKLIFHNPWD